MSRPSGPLIPAARALHEELLALGLHPDDDDFDRALSPCDGCVDLAGLVVTAYARTWLGPRGDQRPAPVKPRGTP